MLNLGAFQPKGIAKYQENCILGIKSNPWVVAGSSILNELEESATKKLNKHSNSLDNIDWLACYDKLKKELKPKGCQISSNRATGVVMTDKFLKGKIGMTKAQVKLKKSTKYRLGLNTERAHNIPEGKRTELGGTPKQITLQRKKI